MFCWSEPIVRRRARLSHDHRVIAWPRIEFERDGIELNERAVRTGVSREFKRSGRTLFDDDGHAESVAGGEVDARLVGTEEFRHAKALPPCRVLGGDNTGVD